METILKDIRYGCRTFVRNPGFTAVAVLSLALGIGANTAVFSFIDTILLKSLPVKDPASLVNFGDGKGRGNHTGPASGAVHFFSWMEYRDFDAHNSVFQDLLAIDSDTNRIYASYEDGAPEGIQSTLVSGNYFGVLGVTPQAGRFFDRSADLAPTALAVLSDGYWRRRFHRNSSIVGQTFRVGNVICTVAGVAPKGFFGTRVGEAPDVWLPLTVQPLFANDRFIDLQNPQDQFLNVIGRLKPDVTLAAAQASVNVLYHQMLPGYIRDNPPANYAKQTATAHIDMTPAARGLSQLRRKYERPLVVLMIVVAMVLLIACANVANLLVAMGAKRQREMAVRVAIGAARGRLIRQMLTEGILLSAGAALIGIVAATGAGKVLVGLISTGPESLPLGFELDLPVLGFTAGVSLLTGILFALMPAIRTGSVDVISSLKESRASMSSPRKVTFGRVLVAGQVALSLALLIAAALLVRSFRNLIDIDTGFDRRNVLVFKIDSDASGYKQDERLAALYARVESGIARIPGVLAASATHHAFNEGHWGEGITIPGRERTESTRTAVLNFATPGVFSTFRIPILAGRAFDDRDNASVARVAVINETFARRVFAGQNPIGRAFFMSPLTDKDVPYTVIGVARDIKSNEVRDEPENFAWLPMAQGPVYADSISVRIAGDTAAMAAAIRKAIHDAEPNLPIRWTTTLAAEVSDSLVSERAISELAAFFAALALLLSAIGLYGTISFAVARRTSEIGIRLALGADRVGVLGMVLKDAMLLVGTGALIGIPLAFAAGRAMQSLLYGIGGLDITSIAVAVASLTLVAGFAGLLPARRAARLDPITALRYE